MYQKIQFVYTYDYFRLIMSSNCLQHSWFLIQDLIGDAATWPAWIRSLFWETQLHYTDRMKIAAFGYNNGLCPDALSSFFRARKVDAKRIEEMVALYKYWNDPIEGVQRRARYRSFDLIHRRMTSLNNRDLEEETNLGLLKK